MILIRAVNYLGDNIIALALAFDLQRFNVVCICVGEDLQDFLEMDMGLRLVTSKYRVNHQPNEFTCLSLDIVWRGIQSYQFYY